MHDARRLIKKDLKNIDIITIGTFKYLIYNLKKDSIELIPIDQMLNDANYKPDLIPKIEIKYNHLEKYIKNDNYDLFYLVNQNSILVKQVLHRFFEG